MNNDIINNVLKVVYMDGTMSFIIQTTGDSDFWYWQVDKWDVIQYFETRNNAAAVYQLAHEKLGKNNCLDFVNDIDNGGLGFSSGSFDNISDCLKDLEVFA